MEPAKVDSELRTKMAGLDIMEVDKASPETPVNTLIPGLESRTLRKRKSLAIETKPSNRRVSMKPRKRIMTDNASLKHIEAIYLNKTVKFESQTLETIYEEPKTASSSNASATLIGGRKLKRLVTFPLGSHYTKEKIKKRRSKIKKLLGNKSFINRKKIPMKVFLETIKCLELDDPVQIQTTANTSTQ